MARKPQQLPADFPAVEVVKGDVLDKNSLLAALLGVENYPERAIRIPAAE